MPITKTMAYEVDEEVFVTIEEAQFAAVRNELREDLSTRVPMLADSPEAGDAVIKAICDHARELAAIFTCDPEHEKPARKPRSDKGTKRAKAEAINRALQDGKQ